MDKLNNLLLRKSADLPAFILVCMPPAISGSLLPILNGLSTCLPKMFPNTD